MKVALLPGARSRAWLAAAAAVLAAGIAVTAWALWPRPAAPQARRYLNLTACLLTGPGGIAPGTPAAPVWAAMENASLATRVRVSYLPGTGPSDTKIMLSTLIQRQCAVIVATSAAAGQVIDAGRSNPRQRFLLVASHVARAAPNTVVVPAARAPARIGQLLHALAAQSAS